MKFRVLVFLLAVALAAPAGARPVAPLRHVASWSFLWQGFIGFFRGFRLFEATDVTWHGLPPPSITAKPTFQ
jgi:hypothetical protein